MPVESTTSGVIRIGNGLTTEFSFSFAVTSEETIGVARVNGLHLTDVDLSEYTVLINSEGTAGSVTFNVAPANGEVLYIARTTAITQLVEVTSQNKYDPVVVQKVWDKLTLIAQELRRDVARAVISPPNVDPQNLYELFQENVEDSEAAAALAQAWAESATPPDPYDPGTKSAKSWAGEAAASEIVAGAAAGTATIKAGEANASAIAAQVAKITWRGPWATGTAYVLRDAVQRNGSSYISKSAHTSGTSTAPGTGASWTTVWDLLAIKGDTGAQGPQGDKGDTGDQGPQGDKGDQGLPGSSSGDVSGPASSVADRIAVFNGTTGKLIKDGGTLISALAPKNSPALTGTPTAPTAAPGTDTTQIATTAFVAANVSTITKATTPEAEAGTGTGIMDATLTAAAIAAQVPSDIGAKVLFNGVGTVAIIESENVSSITDLGIGTYKLNLTTAMPDANYTAVGSLGRDADMDVYGAMGISGRTTTTLRINTATTESILTDYERVSVVIFN